MACNSIFVLYFIVIKLIEREGAITIEMHMSGFGVSPEFTILSPFYTNTPITTHFGNS